MMHDPWSGFLNIAHRGASGVAPENTMAAFEAAIEMGATAVEMDLRANKDGHVVVLHDRSLDRTTDGSGLVSRSDLAELQTLDAGSWFGERFAGERIPTLEDVFERIADRMPLVLHVKERDKGIETRIAELAAERGKIESITVSSTMPDVLANVRKLLPDARTTLIAWVWDWLWLARRAERKVGEVKADRIALRGRNITERLVEHFRESGVSVRAWGVGADEALAEQLVRMGVNGMTFDRPDRLNEICKRIEAELPHTDDPPGSGIQHEARGRTA